MKRDNPAFKRLQELLAAANLAVFDEFSMLGKTFLGKVLSEHARLRTRPVDCHWVVWT